MKDQTISNKILNWYDGKEIDSEVTESETTDDDIDDRSFTIL